ncbi:MAG TPA: NAD(P)-dependent oxidoreductase [Thermoanaerobaculia bacterium]|nr:NAD(P)-dependent oxidoreductase [Thermoanaerobaculia bacterium]
MADRQSRVSRPIDDWERESYVQGSEACRNYSNLTMRVRTLAQQALLAAAAGLGAAVIGRENIEYFYDLMGVVGLLLVVFAVSLFFVDWHYQSAFTAIRNHLTTIEARHHVEELDRLECHDGPWTAHLSVRTRFRDHVASYLPFLLIGEVGAVAAFYGLQNIPFRAWVLGVVAIGGAMVFIESCYLARRHDRGVQQRLQGIRGLVTNGPRSDPSVPSQRSKETNRMTATVLFLQDLDLPREEVARLFEEWDPPVRIVWPEQAGEADTGAVTCLVTVTTPVDRRTLERFPNRRLVAVAFTGYDKVDLEACRERGVAVCNVPTYATDSVAELTLGLTISLLRRIPQEDRGLRDRGWQPAVPGTELKGKVVGILGTGRIGLRVAEIFAVLGCRLVAWSKSERPELGELGGEYLSFDDVLARSDVLCIHLPLNDETRGLIGARELAQMKAGSCLVNVSRGGVVDEQALIRALRDDRGLRAAAMDVFEQEGPGAENPFADSPDTVLTPHVAYRTVEALGRRAEETVENIRAFFAGEERNRVA